MHIKLISKDYLMTKHMSLHVMLVMLCITSYVHAYTVTIHNNLSEPVNLELKTVWGKTYSRQALLPEQKVEFNTLGWCPSHLIVGWKNITRTSKFKDLWKGERIFGRDVVNLCKSFVVDIVPDQNNEFKLILDDGAGPGIVRNRTQSTEIVNNTSGSVHIKLEAKVLNRYNNYVTINTVSFDLVPAASKVISYSPIAASHTVNPFTDMTILGRTGSVRGLYTTISARPQGFIHSRYVIEKNVSHKDSNTQDFILEHAPVAPEPPREPQMIYSR